MDKLNHTSRVCFWGYDETIEITFFVGEEFLKHLCHGMAGAEEGFLKAFDAIHDRIHEIADKVYVHADKGSFAFLLAAGDI